jgi:hypothetical protein
MKYEFSDKKQLATGNNQPTSLAIVVVVVVVVVV